jgi:hypothetical protein
MIDQAVIKSRILEHIAAEVEEQRAGIDEYEKDVRQSIYAKDDFGKGGDTDHYSM